MIFSSKNFEKNYRSKIKSLASLTDAADALSPNELAEIRQKVFQKIAAGPELTGQYSFFNKTHLALRYAASILVGLSLIGGTAFASGGSIPGDLLYPLKMVKEKVQMTLAVSDESKVNLQANFAQARLDELHALSERINNEAPENLGVKPPARTPLTATTGINTQFQPSVQASGTPQGLITRLAATTTTTRTEKSRDERLRDQAQAEATTEVSSAIVNLKRICKKLEAKGNSQAVASVEANILNLQLHAQAEHITSSGGADEGDSSDNHSTDGDSRSPKEMDGSRATTTTEGQPPILNNSSFPGQPRINLEGGEGGRNKGSGD